MYLLVDVYTESAKLINISREFQGMKWIACILEYDSITLENII